MDPRSEQFIEKFFSQNFTQKLDKEKILEKRNYSKSIITNNSTFISSIYKKPVIQKCHKIKYIPCEGIIINCPGTYELECDIDWNSKHESVAITINTSNVKINLNNKVLRNISTNNKIKNVGIQSIGNDNITITNGLVKNMTLYGIQIESCNNLSINNICVVGICLHDLDTRLITPTGIFVSKSDSIIINGCSVSKTKVLTDSSAGILLSECINGIITNCNLSKLLNLDGAVQGLSLILCENIEINKCVSSKFRSKFNGNILTSGHTVLGFVPIFSYNLTFNDCVAIDLIGSCDDCHGMSVFLDDFIKVNNFYASNIYDGISQSNSGAKATGLEVYGINVTVSNSTVENIVAINPQDKQAAGFSAAGKAIVFNNCTSKNVKVVDANNTPDKKLGYGCGFGWAPDPRPEFREIYAIDVLYLNCSAYKCQVGFDTFNHIDSTWSNVKCCDCEKCIYVQKCGTRTISCNPCSECNPSIKVTLINVASGNKFINDCNK